jgi:hypothetical protein
MVGDIMHIANISAKRTVWNIMYIAKSSARGMLCDAVYTDLRVMWLKMYTANISAGRMVWDIMYTANS